METNEIIALVVLGALAGTAAASVMGLRKSKGRMEQALVNTLIGIVGAVVGGFLFRALNLEDDLPDILNASISLADLLVAFIGAIIVILVVGMIRRR